MTRLRGPLDAIIEVYDTVVVECESLEDADKLGPDLAYLLGGMLKGAPCAWPADRAIVKLLQKNLPAKHPVFSFIEIEPINFLEE